MNFYNIRDSPWRRTRNLVLAFGMYPGPRTPVSPLTPFENNRPEQYMPICS